MTTLSAQGYLDVLTPIMAQVAQQADGPVQEAADLIARSVLADGVLQTFGSGHSEGLAMELAGRAGGLVPSNRISLRDVVVHGGESPEVLGRGILERDPDIAQRLYDLAAPRPSDVFVIASNSGVNGSIVEMFWSVKEHGHPRIAITSTQHTSGVEQAHPDERQRELALHVEPVQRIAHRGPLRTLRLRR